MDDQLLTPRKWYEKSWVIILFLLFFWPVGLFLMWRFADWSKAAKVVVTIIIAICAIVWLVTILIGGILFALHSTGDDLGEAVESREHRLEESDEHAPSASDSNLSDNGSDVKLQFDDRNWNLVDQKKDPNKYILYYTPEDTKNELLTVAFRGDMAGTTPQQFAAIMEQTIRKRANGNLNWNVFNKRNNELMSEIIVQNDSTFGSQHGLYRIIATENGIYSIHYAIKEAPTSQENRQKWIDLLLKAEVK